MSDLHPSKVSYYGRNKRIFLSNPRYKSLCRVKTKPNFNLLIKQETTRFIEACGPLIKIKDPALYSSITGKKAKQAPLVSEKTNQEEVKEKTSYDDLDAYQKKREAERKAELDKAREKLKKKEVKFNFISPRKDWSIYGGWVNAHEPVNKGRLGSTQEWRKEKPYPVYY
jgi:DNA repair exonuclease SbcCD nuclease subunit